MTNFTDGTKTVSIWMENVNGVEWSADFYDVGGLEYDEEAEAYQVESIEYLIDQAKDYMAWIGDFYEAGAKEGETLTVSGDINVTIEA